MKNNFQYIVVGAGIVGLAISEILSRKSNGNILVIDKEKKFGLHTSSRNSEVVHSGFYYPQDSLKSKLCVKGNKMMYEFCDKYNIPYKKCGKLIVANTKEEITTLDDILLSSYKNGVEAQIISKKDSLKIEPNVRCKKSLWVPSTGIVDSHLVMSKLENLSLSRDVSILYNLELDSIQKIDSGYSIDFVNDDSIITTDCIINCAGLWAHEIANQLLENKYEVEYYKGDYFKTSDIKNINSLIYPVPNNLSLGIHVVINLNGEVLFGPNVYKIDSVSYQNDSRYKETFLKEANKLLVNNIKDIYIDYSGIRPKIKYDGRLNDFIIKEEKTLKNFYNLIGIDSPGLTSSLAIAEYVYSLIQID